MPGQGIVFFKTGSFPAQTPISAKTEDDWVLILAGRWEPTRKFRIFFYETIRQKHAEEHHFLRGVDVRH